MGLAGRENYGDAAVDFVELKREGNICRVKAIIFPEHKVYNKGYNVDADIDEKKEKILQVLCHDCVASLGGCKHTVAFLMWLHRRSEDPSPTEVECNWKK
ncbi:uncharacterized protein LOC117178739 [Belonocnema kinseyi]|uniref:uncharacterized protein LOC117178739 n=1 Tax=Belonocnema kinseyi TaxID=2817044 RepID=UPI00143D2805|nr:uncharacterized protein LOC117178739 [Belonocnema kinseyi]